MDERIVNYVGPIQASRKKAVSFCGTVIDGDIPTIGTIVLDDLLYAGVIYDIHSKKKTVSEGVLIIPYFPAHSLIQTTMNLFCSID